MPHFPRDLYFPGLTVPSSRDDVSTTLILGEVVVYSARSPRKQGIRTIRGVLAGRQVASETPLFFPESFTRVRPLIVHPLDDAEDAGKAERSIG